MESKLCSRCKIEKLLDEFYFSTVNGVYSAWCKSCTSEYHRDKRRSQEGDAIRARAREYRRINREKINEKNRERYAADPERFKSYKIKWRTLNHEVYLRQAKEQRLKHIERVKKYKKQYEQDNKDKKKKWDKKYRETHREQRNEYSRIRKAQDPLFNLKHQIGTLVLHSLKKGGYKKDSKTAEIVGCDYDKLWTHLKSTWYYNYGKEWNGEPFHIDHIVPLATARNKREIIDLCHYSNLQLLTPRDNMDKKDKLDWVLGENLPRS